jgi:serine protease inhibitor
MKFHSWVKEKTNGKIKEILPGSASTETRVILANAIYFKAEWQEAFFDGATGFKKFYPNGKDSNYSVLVELMAHGGSLTINGKLLQILMFNSFFHPQENSLIITIQKATAKYWGCLTNKMRQQCT